MLSEFTAWLWSLVVAAFGWLWDLLKDLAIEVLDLLLSAIAFLVGTVPLPDFLTSGLGTIFGGLGEPILYILSAAGFTQALAIYGAGWAFRLVRKFVTLFQW